MKIILDTNFLISSLNFKMDVFSDLRGNELFVINGVVRELEKLSIGRGKDGISARISLDLVKRKGLKVLASKEKDTDKSLLEYSKVGYAIATQDIVLKRKIKENSGKVIFIRQKKHLII